MFYVYEDGAKKRVLDKINNNNKFIRVSIIKNSSNKTTK